MTGVQISVSVIHGETDSPYLNDSIYVVLLRHFVRIAVTAT